MVVWGDLLFLINFSMDFLCFYICCRLRHERLSTGRGALAALLGGIYSVASLFVVADRWLSLALDILVMCVMCLCVWGEKIMGVWRFFKACALYFFISALLGGLMTALFSLFNRIEMFVGDVGIEDGVDVWIFAVLALVSCIFTLRGGRAFRTSATRGTAIIEIESDRGRVRLKALVDSGNGAVEPISEKSVVFVRLDALAGVLGESELKVFSEYGRTHDIPVSVASRIRLVPVATVSGSALLPAVRFKRVGLIMKEGTKEIDVYIAPTAAESLRGHDAIISHEATVF